MLFSRLLLVVFLLLPVSGHTLSDACQSALSALFSSEISEEEAGDFLKVQGDITLHRLAWAYLKAQESDNSEKLESIQSTILVLLDEKYTSTDPKFIKAREDFESQPLSRTMLAEIGPYLKDYLAQTFSEEDDPFILNASDLKMLHALAKFEKANAKNDVYDSRMLAKDSPEGMLNFVKIINSSYKVSPSSKEENLNIELRLQGLESTISNLQSRLNQFFKQIKTPSQCKDDGICSEEELGEFFVQNEVVQKIFWDTVSDKLLSDDILLNNLTYGELWLKTNGKVNSQTSVSQVKEVPQKSKATTKKSAPPKKPYDQKVSTVQTGTKIKTTQNSSVRSFYASSTGLYIEDPVSVILKDNKSLTKKSLEANGAKYLEAFSDAVLNDDKVFSVGNKIYSRKTGKELSYQQAMGEIPPKRRAELQGSLNHKDTAFRAEQVKAMVNGQKSFLYKDKYYTLQGTAAEPALIISSIKTKKTGVNHPVKNYMGMEKNYLSARAVALDNNKPYFKVGNQIYATDTGRGITSPFRSIASTKDVKIEKEKRVQYENLSDRELVINYHRDNAKKGVCQYYAIIDKKSAIITVYNLAGKKQFETQVLVGNVRNDERTRWSVYNDNQRMTNRSTGAGIYTVSKPKLGHKYYSSTFNNNILQMLDQDGKDQVFAIHQVPVNMPERNKLFGGKVEDRWVSSGCANLKLSDYKKLTQWIGPTCQVYVLPEEKQNKFVVRDNKVQFVSTDYTKKENLYNYDKTKNSSLPISIRITNSEGKTENSQKFVNALQTEKATLMKTFGLSNDEYNDLASLAYGIMGNESDFGRSKKYWYKENFQGDVVIAKAAKKLFSGKNPFSKDVLNTSRGFTQIKIFPEGDWKKLPQYKHINKSNLGDPKNSAIATMAYLVDAARTLKRIAAENAKDPKKVKISKENMVDYLGYIYQGRMGALKSAEDPANADFNTYVQKLRKHMSYIEIAQKIQ